MKKRQIYRDFTHIRDHILNAKKSGNGDVNLDLDLALNMLNMVMEREQKARRKHE